MTTIFRLLRILICGLPAAVTCSATAAPGDADAGFNPDAGGRVLCAVVQSGAKVIIAGEFTSVGGETRNHIARLNSDGTLDTTFNPATNGNVACMAVQEDGKIIIGGDFTAAGMVTRRRLARLNADGTIDPDFDPDVSGGSFPIVHSMAVQPDGMIVIGGSFTSVGGVTRNRIARLDVDGTLDASFNPGTSGTVRCLALQPDGKIIVGGQFGMVAGTTRNRLARLNADGTVEMAFDPNMNNHVNGVALLPDGKMVVGGEFTAVGAETRNYIARLSAAGALDTEFNPNANGQVRSVAVQTDGAIVIAGDFLTVGTTSRNRMARLNADGALDATFNPNANSPVYAVALQSDGKIVIGGGFTAVGGLSRDRVARLENDPATQELTAPAANRVQWLRGGSSPETQESAFELSVDSGSTWSPLGNGTRIAGGWELTGLILPASGTIRAGARIPGGQYNGSTWLVEELHTFAFSPEMAVEHPAGTSLEAGAATVDFGVPLRGASTSRDFTVRNQGLHDLTITGITFDGDHGPDFAVTPEPAFPVAVVAGDSTTFTVRFTPALAGSKTAVMHLASNDSDEATFDIGLTGRALAPDADDDGDGMANAAEVMLAKSGFDPLVPSAELVTQLRASGLYLAIDVQTLALTEPLLEKDSVTGRFRLSIGVEKSVNLSEWTLLPDPVNFDITPVDPAPIFYRVLGKKP